MKVHPEKLIQITFIINKTLHRVMAEFVTLCKIALPKYDYGECNLKSFTETKWKTWGKWKLLKIAESNSL